MAYDEIAIAALDALDELIADSTSPTGVTNVTYSDGY